MLQELENIDDDLDRFGLQLIKSDYNNLQSNYGIKKVELHAVKLKKFMSFMEIQDNYLIVIEIVSYWSKALSFFYYIRFQLSYTSINKNPPYTQMTLTTKKRY